VGERRKRLSRGPAPACEEEDVRNVSELIGKPVISVETGDKLGTVADALLADGDVRLVALVIGGGLLGTEHVLPFRDVQTLGGDTILARSQAGVVGAREWHEGGVRTTRSSALKGRPVVTAAGHRLGEVSDFVVDDQTGAFDALEVATSDFGGLRTKRSLVRAGAEIRIGPDAVVVPESAAVTADEVRRAEGEPPLQ
jgi:uncharacterized protein YrrD